MSSILFITFSSKELLARKFTTDKSMIVNDSLANQKFPSDSFYENSIYREDDVIRSGNTLFVNDDWLFLIENWYNLEIYNVSDVNEPGLVKNYTVPDVDYDSTMIVQDNYLYIYNKYSNSIFVLDCTDPMSIFEETRYTGLEDLSNFAINDWYLYTMSENNFTIYDFENFSTLEQLDSYYNDSYSFYDFNIRGNYSYVLDRYKGPVILDISNNTNIQYLGEIIFNEDYFKTAIYIKSDRLFLYDNSLELFIFNISDPLNIALISSYELHNYSINDIIINENILFMLDPDNLFIFDISDLGQIQAISNYSAPEFSTSFSSFIVQNNFIYIHNIYYGHFVSRNPLFIVNIIDLESPLHVFPPEEFDFWDWLDALSKAMLAVAIITIALPLTGITIFLIIFFARKKKKTVTEGINDNQEKLGE